MAAIFTDEVLRSHLAMRGGTVLHKAHLAPAARYSEDIDLVLTKPMDSTPLEKHLLRVLTPILGASTRMSLALSATAGGGNCSGTNSATGLMACTPALSPPTSKARPSCLSQR